MAPGTAESVTEAGTPCTAQFHTAETDPSRSGQLSSGHGARDLCATMDSTCGRGERDSSRDTCDGTTGRD